MKENRNVIIGSFILFLVLFITQVDLTFGFIATGIVGVFCLFSAITIVAVAIIAILKKKTNLIMQCSIVAISLFLAIIASNIINKIKLEASQDTASGIILALEDFKKEKGNYPSSLNELTPIYLEEIPKPHVGFINKQKFHYNKSNDKEKYVLGFPYAAWMLSQYDSELGEWVVDD
ncbi:MAG: type II secretion system protein [Planctomycetota bacterium]|jgi:hypothetical protein